MIANTSPWLVFFFFIFSGTITTRAQSTHVVSEPFGYSTTTLLANSDTLVSVPFQQPAAYSGQVVSVTGNVVTVSGVPNWAPGQFAYAAGTQPSTYYLFVRSGAKEGHAYTIANNAAGSVTVDPESDNLTGIVAGDFVRVIPYWTLGTLFPASSAGLAFAATTNISAPETTLFLYDSRNDGINSAPAGYFFYDGAWRQSGQSPSVSRDDQIIRPSAHFRVRNGGNGGVLVASGAVVMEKHAILLNTQTTSAQDNAVAVLRPVPVSLNDSGLASGNVFASSASALARVDLLMMFDNTEAKLNKPASDYYIFLNNGWRKLGQPLTQDFGADLVFGPGKAVVIRKAASPDGAPRTWVNDPKY